MTHAFDACARWLSRPWVCAGFIATLPTGAAIGWYLGWSADYLLAFNLYMSAVPFVTMFVLVYTQSRDTLAAQVQNSELIRAIPEARNELIGLESKTPEEIATLRNQE